MLVMDFCDECGDLIAPSASKKVKSKSCCSRCEDNRKQAKLGTVSQNKSADKDTTTEDSDSDIEVDDAIKQQWERKQEELKAQMITGDSDIMKTIFTKVNEESICSEDKFYIGGVDLSFVKGDHINACAALVVTTFPGLETVYEDFQMVKLTAPYIPGFLAFREVEYLVDLYDKMKRKFPEFLPQVILVDGNGILHPREFGLACHLGVLLDIPCIGVAKNLFQVDGLEKDDNHLDKISKLQRGGDRFPLVGASGKTLGMALRSCDSSSNPVYVSVGHKVSLDTAMFLVHRCCKFRIPEPVRKADIKSREFLRILFPTES